MKKGIISIALVLGTFSVANAIPAPKYLSITDWDKCLVSEEKGTSASWCMPAEKGTECPQDSWEKLNDLGDGHKIPPCVPANS